MPNVRKLLSIGHSYIVSLNRRLVNEIAHLGEGRWEVTTVAPKAMYADARYLTLSQEENELCQLIGLPVYLSQFIHVMTYDWQLKNIINQSWDLIHCWEEPYILSGGQIAWWKNPQTTLVYTTMPSYSKYYPFPFNFIERYSMKQAKGWICPGEITAQILRNRLGYDLPMRLIPFGVDSNHFTLNLHAKKQTRQLLGYEDNDIPVIGYLGRLVPEKGLDLLMRVLDNLQTPWRAVFVGKGPMETALDEWASKYPEKVRIFTKITHQEVPQYLKAMDILVAPSQTVANWREQFGRMLIEAMSCGLPVIGSDSGEIPYVIGDTGIIVGEKDQIGWVKAISELLENPDLRRELGNRGREKVLNHYTWPKVAQQHLEFFEELINY